MLYETHIKIGENSLTILDNNEKSFIQEKIFLRGCILPDVQPKYRVRKHRLGQFQSEINKKIEYLSSINKESLSDPMINKKFNRDLGIVCHFMCDFFCMPHTRWGVKESMNLKHALYEKELNKKLFKFEKINDYYEIKDYDDYLRFLKENLNNHSSEDITENHHENDLYYAMYISNSVIKYILSNINKR